MASLLLHTPAGQAEAACPEGMGGGRGAHLTGAVVRWALGGSRASVPPHVGDLVWSGVHASAPPDTPRPLPSTPHLLSPGGAGSLWESCRENRAGVGSSPPPPWSPLPSPLGADCRSGRRLRVCSERHGCVEVGGGRRLVLRLPATGKHLSSGPYHVSPHGSICRELFLEPLQPPRLLGVFRALCGLESIFLSPQRAGGPRPSRAALAGGGGGGSGHKPWCFPPGTRGPTGDTGSQESGIPGKDWDERGARGHAPGVQRARARTCRPGWN